MKSSTVIRTADLRGLGRLGVEAVQQVAALVEAMHGGIQRVATLRAPRAGALPDPIARLAYAGVRGISGLVGWGVELGTRGFAAAPPPQAPEPRRDALLAALNGVVGDHLVRSGNPLAMPMRIWFRDRLLPLDDPEALRVALFGTRPRIALLLHGLCMTPWHWYRPQPADQTAPSAAGTKGADPATEAAADFPALLALRGYEVMHLQYNSGRRIGENGAELSVALQTLVDALPAPPAACVLLGHSMGGLVARSACHAAAAHGNDWVQRPITLIGLGTPHHGAPLERAGHGVESLLEALPLVSPFARLGRVRSAGILDLRHGALGADSAPLAPSPASVKLHAVAATLSKSAEGARPRGDGLVPVASALGRHRDARRDLGIPTERQALIADVGHIGLLLHPEALRQVSDWLDQPG